ncbi:MAG TPA: hypothetical protein VGI50_07015 [Solirubrobacteraceae bacterium]
MSDQSLQEEQQMPAGGVKDSGSGRVGGSAVIGGFTEKHWAIMQSGMRGAFPFLMASEVA